jgi:hypothetical protein|tara:strand:+ start:9827 stop:9967 length:141 start_codon:yes stop_codon:yes gene_type:complete
MGLEDNNSLDNSAISQWLHPVYQPVGYRSTIDIVFAVDFYPNSPVP